MIGGETEENPKEMINQPRIHGRADEVALTDLSVQQSNGPGYLERALR